MTWINVADTALKIGLGAIITAVAGYMTLRLTQSFEVNKRKEDWFNKLLDERKITYVEFSALSHALIQKYQFSNCELPTEEYNSYLALHSKIQILACDKIRICVGEAFNLTTQFIITSINNNDIKDRLRSSAQKKISEFQMYAQHDVTQKYNK